MYNVYVCIYYLKYNEEKLGLGLGLEGSVVGKGLPLNLAIYITGYW